MDFYKNNAYPDVVLHDCCFTISKFHDNLCFSFPTGVGISADNDVIWNIPAKIKISKLDPSALCILSVKPKMAIGQLRWILKEISLENLEQIFYSGHSLQVIDEFYSYGQAIWTCAIYPYDKRLSKKFGNISLHVTTESPLEYYLDKK